MGDSTDRDYRFEIALSFAGDNKRDLVRSVAEILQAELGEGRIFFDEWFEHEIAGTDADVVLQRIFNQETRLVVTCVCRRYNEKPWTQDEWRAIRSLERTLRDGGWANVKRLRFLPLRLGDGYVDGLFDTAIVPDKRNESPGEIAAFILNRLKLIREATQSPHPGASPLTSRSDINVTTTAGRGDYPAAASVGSSRTVRGSDARNLFRTAGPVPPNSPVYVVRECDTKLHHAIGRSPLVAVNGEYEIGKSSLLARTHYLLRTRWEIVIRDLNGVRTDHEAVFVEEFFAFFESSLGGVGSWEQLVQLLRERRTLILMDEFGSLSTSVAAAFVPKLFWLTEKLGGRLGVVVTLPQPIHVFLQARGLVNPKFPRAWKPVPIPPFSRSEVSRLLQQLPLRARKAAVSRLDQIMEMSSGRPRRVQSLCSHLVAESQPAIMDKLIRDENSYQ